MISLSRLYTVFNLCAPCVLSLANKHFFPVNRISQPVLHSTETIHVRYSVCLCFVAVMCCLLAETDRAPSVLCL